MNRNYNKALLSLGLSGMMALSLAAPVFADDNTTTPTDAKAYITKQFDMPVGTSLPDGGESFSFTISNLKKADKNVASNPTFTNTIKIEKPTSTNSISKKTVELNNAGNEYKIARYVGYSGLFENSETSAGQKLNNFLKTSTEGGVGDYTFTITEVQPKDGSHTESSQNPATVDDNTTLIKNTTLTYSQAVYKASLNVKNDDANNKYISDLRITKETGDDGVGISSDNEKKVDPSKPQDNVPGSGGLRFVNEYTEKITKNGTGGTIPDPDPSNPTKDDPRDLVFSVGKVVSGNMADKDQAFTFKIGVTRPSLVKETSDTTFTAKIYKADNNDPIVDPTGRADAGYIDSTKKTITFKSGSPITVSLKHGEKLVFDSLYVGTAFEAQETDTNSSDYVSSTYSRLNGGQPAERAKERALVTGNVSEGTDTVVVVNTKNSVSPTGIFVDNLPFILLVLGVIAAFAGYIVSKRRREMR